jgi:hypothetical protein
MDKGTEECPVFSKEVPSEVSIKLKNVGEA